MIKPVLLFFVSIIFPILSLFAFPPSDFQFISYGKMPTWKGVAVNWNSVPKVYVYDKRVYEGHAEFVSRALTKKTSFSVFKNKTRYYQKREYLPFYLYDLREKEFHIDNVSFSCAVLLQDYDYDDTSPGMAEEINKLVKLISASEYLQEARCLAVLLNNDSVLGKNRTAASLSEKGIPFTDLSTLLKHMGASKLEVLNHGDAAGVLKHITKEEDVFLLNQNEIGLFSFLPERIPPIAAIITLVPQTPLSHTNLLAKNRNTPNLYVTGIDAYPGLKDMIGKIVRVEAIRNHIDIREITPEQFDSFKKKKRKLNLKIPDPEIKIKSVIPLQNDFKNLLKPEYIGAKAANYAVLRELFPDNVKPAFAIGFYYYFETIKGETSDLIKSFLSDVKRNDNEKRNSYLKQIRTSIQNSSLSSSFKNKLGLLIKNHFKNKRIRLRSSTNCEDLPDFNGAGLYESKGYETSEDFSVLEKKILKVYASLWSERAYLEREYYGIDHEKSAMSILIHESFKDETANGVALTVPLPDGSFDIFVNVQTGEESVTNPSGDHTPESFILSGSNYKMERIYTRSDIQNIFIENKENNSVSKELALATVKIHNRLISNLYKTGINGAFGTDIEFKIMKEGGRSKLYIKQARLLKY